MTLAIDPIQVTETADPIECIQMMDDAFIASIERKLYYPTRDCVVIDMVKRGEAKFTGFSFGNKNGEIFMKMYYQPKGMSGTLPYILLRVAKFDVSLS